MEPTLDQVREELGEIHEQLLDLPRDDFARRAELRARQQELRRVSYQLAEGEAMHDAKALKAAFKRLAQVRDKLVAQHLAYDSTSGGVGGIEGTFLLAVNRAMDEGMGLDEVEDRMKRIITQLRDAQ